MVTVPGPCTSAWALASNDISVHLFQIWIGVALCCSCSLIDRVLDFLFHLGKSPRSCGALVLQPLVQQLDWITTFPGFEFPRRPVFGGVRARVTAETIGLHLQQRGTVPRPRAFDAARCRHVPSRDIHAIDDF